MLEIRGGSDSQTTPRQTLNAGVGPALRAWIDRGTRYIFGRDFFISYARRDAAAYAAAIANELGTTHSCYLDQLAAPRGMELPAPIRRELSRATTFVLVGSEAAIESHYVCEEIRRFLESGRPIVVLDIGGALASAPWGAAPWSQLVGVYRQPDSSEALRIGRPSAATLAYLRDSFAFTRHDRRLRRASAAAAGLLVAAIGGGTFVSGLATQRAVDAGRRAESAQADETKARSRAEAEGRRASEAGQLATAAQEQETAARARAEAQERIATSRRLANESSSRLDADPELALVLAAHSFNVAPTMEARRALLSGLSHYPGLSRIVRAPTSPLPGTFAASADGRVFATGDKRSIEVWDAEPLRRRMHMRAPGGEERTLALGPDGAILAVAAFDNVVFVDSATGHEVGRIVNPIQVGPMAFVDANRLAIGVGEDVQLWDLTDRARPVSRGTLLSLDGDPVAIAADPGGRMLAAASFKTIVTCEMSSCASTVQPLTTSEDAGGFFSLSFAPRTDIPILGAINLGSRLVLWELMTRQRLVDLSMVRDLDLVAARSDLDRDFYSVALGPGADRVVVGSAEGRFMSAGVQELMTWSQVVHAAPEKSGIRDAEEALFPGRRPAVRKLAYPPGPSQVAVTAHGQVIAAQTGGGVSLWDPSSSSAFEFDRPWKGQSGAPHAVSADGHHVVDASSNGVRLWDATDERASVTIAFPSPKALAIGADTGLIAAVDSAGGGSPWRTLALWDARGRPLFRTRVDRRVAPSVAPGTYPAQLVVSGKSPAYLVGLVLADGTAAVWHVESGTTRLVDVRAGAERLGMNPNAAEFAVAGRDGSVSVWDAKGERNIRLAGLATHIAALSYSSDGGALAAASADRGGGVVTWDLHARTEPTMWKLSDISSDKTLVAFSDDLHALAVAEASTVNVWDVESQVLLISRAVPSEVTSVTFDREGGLIVGHGDGLTYIDLNPTRLVGYVCDITTRTLTPEESQRYLGAASTTWRCPRSEGEAPSR